MSKYTTQELEKLQNSLQDTVVRQDFLNKEVSSSEEETEEVRVEKKRGVRYDSATGKLMEEFIAQQRQLLKTNKRIFSLENELSTQEITSRYLKLEYNNTLIKLGELSKAHNQLETSRKENWVYRVVILFYILYYVYFLVY